MTFIEMETRLCLLTKQRADLIQARPATGQAVDPDGARQNMKPLTNEIDRMDHAIWVARQQELSRQTIEMERARWDEI